MLKIKNIIFTLMFSSILIGCGSNDSNRDLQRTRVREDIELRRAELTPLVGEYEGELLDERSGLKRPFRIYITISGQNYEGDKIPDETASPTLRAVIQYYAHSNSNIYLDFKFSKSDIDTETKTIWFYSSEPDGSLEAHYDGLFLEGDWSVASRGAIGSFKAEKIK